MNEDLFDILVVEGERLPGKYHACIVDAGHMPPQFADLNVEKCGTSLSSHNADMIPEALNVWFALRGIWDPQFPIRPRPRLVVNNTGLR
jgi:hypothetical protein